MPTRTGSPLISYTKLSPNFTKPRKGPIRRHTPHCVAGDLSVESILGLSSFMNPDSKNGSSVSYAIGKDGRVGLGVDEKNRPWTTSNGTNDHEAITYELSNIGREPDWKMSDIVINSWLDLAVEVTQFYGFKKVNYKEKPSNIVPANVESWIKTWAKDDEMIITLHRWYWNKACPGDYFVKQLPWLVEEMNIRLSGGVPTLFGASIPIQAPVIVQPVPKQETAFKPYTIRITASALNVRLKPDINSKVVKTLVNDKNIYTISEEANGPGTDKWGHLKSGLGWIALMYTTKV